MSGGYIKRSYKFYCFLTKVGSDPANPIDVGGAAIAPHLPPTPPPPRPT